MLRHLGVLSCAFIDENLENYPTILREGLTALLSVRFQLFIINCLYSYTIPAQAIFQHSTSKEPNMAMLKSQNLFVKLVFA